MEIEWGIIRLCKTPTLEGTYGHVFRTSMYCKGKRFTLYSAPTDIIIPTGLVLFIAEGGVGNSFCLGSAAFRCDVYV